MSGERMDGHRGSEFSYDDGSRAASEKSYVSSKTKRSGHITGSLDIAENPLCPRIRGLCCLIILFNLAIILVCLGFVVVCQLFEPAFAWWVGLFILIFGFVTLIGCFIYCFVICREHKQEMEEKNGELQWTHHWSKTMRFGEINYDNQQEPRY